MIVVRVELHSAITGQITELARCVITNDGGSRSARIGHYRAASFRGRSAAVLDRLHVQRRGEVRDWPRQRLHVWNLVSEALRAMGYGRSPKPAAEGMSDA